MASLEDIDLRANDVDQKIDRLSSEEKELEKEESAELQKIKLLRQDIQDRKREDVQGDFVEAIKIFERISKDLKQTSAELYTIAEEIKNNTDEEFKVVEGLADNVIMLRETSKIEGFAESINKTKTNADRVEKEFEQLGKEVKEAHKEAKELVKIDDVLNSIETLDNPEEELRISIDRLKAAEGKLPEISAKLKDIEEGKTQTNNTIAENTGRRDFMKAAGALSASALFGLSGCISPEARKMWGVGEGGPGSDAKKIWVNENGSSSGANNGRSEFDLNPFVRSDKADSINLTEDAAKVMETVLEADNKTRNALSIYHNHSTENLPDEDELKKMWEFFDEAVKKYQQAESFAETGFDSAERLINYLEEINKMYRDGIDYLQMSRNSMQAGHQDDAEDQLKNYQNKFLEAIEKIEEKKISDYELKQALVQG